MGFLGSLAKGFGAVGGFLVGGPAGAAAGYKAASSLNKAFSRAEPAPPPPSYDVPQPEYQPPVYVPPPAPVMMAQPPRPFILPEFSVAPAMGGGPVNTFDPPAMSPTKGPQVKRAPARSAPKRKQKAISPYGHRKRAAMGAKPKPKKLKFGTPAWRAKFMKKKK